MIDALRLVLLGLVIGLAAASAGAFGIEPLLFQTSAHDPAVRVAAAVVVVLTAMIAALLPAYRAISVQPIEALRGE